MRISRGIHAAFASALCLVGLSVAGCDSAPDASAALEANIRANAQVTAKVSYETLTVDPPETTTVVTTVANRPPDRRVDRVSNEENDSFFARGGGLIKCADSECRYVDASEGPVLDRLTFADMSLGFGGTLLQEARADGDVQSLPDREIAGMKAECFSVVPRDDSGLSVHICFSSADRVLLSMELSNTHYPGVSGSITATSVTYEVTDEDLALPYPLVQQ